MKKSKEYNSVLELVKDISDDKSFQKEFEKEVADKSLSKTLFTMRCQKGITQTRMAELLGCTQGRLSKLENASVNSIKVSDLLAYSKVLELDMTVQFHESMSVVESVKYHAFEIKKHLDKLAELASRDDDIFDGVVNFYGEYLDNMLKLFEDSAKKLPNCSRQKTPSTLEVVSPGGMNSCKQSSTNTRRVASIV